MLLNIEIRREIIRIHFQFTNTQGDNGGVLMEKDMSLSPQAKELLRIYEVLGVKEQTRLMSFAYELEEKSQSTNQA